jgi:hypothetical protein
VAWPPIELLQEVTKKPGARAAAWLLYSFVSYYNKGEWIVWYPMAVVAERGATSVRALRRDISLLGNWVFREDREDYNGRSRSVLVLRKGDPSLNDPKRSAEGGQGWPPERPTLADDPADLGRPPADLILVLKDGRVIERGTHSTLLAQGGFYADLHRRQLLEEEVERTA